MEDLAGDTAGVLGDKVEGFKGWAGVAFSLSH